jgi:hypothetical protein
MIKKIMILVSFLLLAQMLGGLNLNTTTYDNALGETTRHSGDTIDVTTGTAPTIDGTMGAGEWTDASWVSTNMAGVVATIYYKHDQNNFYVAFECGENSMSEIYFDINNDGGTNPQSDDFLLHASMATYENPGTGSGWGTQSNANGWSANTGFIPVREFSVSYTKLGITAGTAKTIGVAFRDMIQSGMGYWPAAATDNNPNSWADMSSSDNWGTGGPANKLPILAGGLVNPSTGDTNTNFTFNVTYWDLDDDVPTLNKIFIDDIGYDMITTDTTYTDGSNFQYSTKLSAGDHEFYFKFNDSKIDVRLPFTGVFTGPNVIIPNAAPTLISGGIPNGTYSINEDSGGGNDLIDLEEYFGDDRDDGDLIFEVVYKEDPLKLDAVIDGQYLDIGQKLENWFGKLEFQVKAKDKGLDGEVGGDTDLERLSNKFSVSVLPTNDPPVFTKLGTKDVVEYTVVRYIGAEAAKEDNLFKLQLLVSEPDIEMGVKDDLVYITNSSLVDIIPDTEDPLKANISLLPENEDVGFVYAKITVRDQYGEQDILNLEINVENTNDDPTFDSVQLETSNISVQDHEIKLIGTDGAYEDSWFNFTVIAIDPDVEIGIEDILNFHTNITSTNFHIDLITGEISYLPEQKDVGMFYINVTVSDSHGSEADDFVDIIVEVKNTNDPPDIPKIFIIGSKTVFNEGDYVNATGFATDPDFGFDPQEKLTYKWESDEDGSLGIDSKLSTTSLSVGVHNITLTVTDRYGANAEVVATITVKEAPVDTPVQTQEEEKETVAEDRTSLWLAAVIIVIIVIIIILFMFLKKKKKAEEKTEVVPQYPQDYQQPQELQQDQQLPYSPEQPPMIPQPTIPPEQQIPQPLPPVPLPAGPQQAVQDDQSIQSQAVPSDPAVQPQQQGYDNTAAQPQQIPQATQLTPAPQTTPESQATTQNLCATCSQPLTYIAQSNNYYCYQCQKYA